MSIVRSLGGDLTNQIGSEVTNSLVQIISELEQYKEQAGEDLKNKITLKFHQIYGVVMMLDVNSLCELTKETGVLLEKLDDTGNLERAHSGLELILKAIKRIQKGESEDLPSIVEFINFLRSQEGKKGVEISALFSPFIDYYPSFNVGEKLGKNQFIKTVKQLRYEYQSALVQWLRDGDLTGIGEVSGVLSKLMNGSSFGVVVRLWWVSSAYVDFLRENTVENMEIHVQVLRWLDDYLRILANSGEASMVRMPADEVIKVMLFYIAIGSKRTQLMDEVTTAYRLQEYAPELTILSSGEDDVDVSVDFSQLPVAELDNWLDAHEEQDRTLVEEINGLIQEKIHTFEGTDVYQVLSLLIALPNIRVRDYEEDIAAIVLHIKQLQTSPEVYQDIDWQTQLGRFQVFLFQQDEGNEEQDNSVDYTLSDKEKFRLFEKIQEEVHDSLKQVEIKLDEYSKDYTQPELISGAQDSIKQIRGVLELYGDPKVSLLTRRMEQQFQEIESDKNKLNWQLVEALAVAITALQEYLKGRQEQRTDLDFILDRGISDLDIAEGKSVSRKDVESLLENVSSSLFSWLGSQSDFELFGQLKSAIRDLSSLAKKTNQEEVDSVLQEQSRLIDVIAQEPAYLNETIKSALQENMANIAESFIQLYGTEDTEQEIKLSNKLQWQRSQIKDTDDNEKVRYHDDMSSQELTEEIDKSELEGEQGVGGGGYGHRATQIAKENAIEKDADAIDETILKVFIEESQEVVENATQAIELCRHDLQNREAIRDLRRCFHTLKGSGRMVGLNNIGEIAWFAESSLNFILDTEQDLSLEGLDFANDALELVKTHLLSEYQQQSDIIISGWGERAQALVTQYEKSESAYFDEESSIGIGSEDTIELFTITPDDAPFIERTSLLERHSELTSEFISIHDDEIRSAFKNDVIAVVSNIMPLLEVETEFEALNQQLAIAIHTLHGNAKTLDMDEMASVFSQLEDWYQVKAEQQFSYTSIDIDKLCDVFHLADQLVKSEKKTEPYFTIDEKKWEEARLYFSIDPLKEDNIEPDVEPVNELKIDNLLDLEVEGEDVNNAAYGELGVANEIEKIELIEVSDDLGSSLVSENIIDTETPSNISIEISESLSEIGGLLEDNEENIDFTEIDQFKSSLDAVKIGKLGGSGANQRVSSIADFAEEDDYDEDFADTFFEELLEIQTGLENLMADVKSDSRQKNLESEAEIARSLHTIKGGAMMVGAINLGRLTHEVETVFALPSAEDGVVIDKEKKDILAMYIDSISLAKKCYESDETLVVPSELSHLIVSKIEKANNLEKSAYSSSLEQAVDLEQGIALSQPDKKEEGKQVDALVIQSLGRQELSDAKPVDSTPTIEKNEEAESDKKEGEQQKNLHQKGAPVHRYDHNRNNQFTNIHSSPAKTELKIATKTLDNLTNFISDVNVNRSYIKEEIGAIKEVVERLYDNIALFSSQIRELEVEADTNIISQSKNTQMQSGQDNEEFDPLELDKYSKLQQLSRELAENLEPLNETQSLLQGIVNRTERSLQKQERLNRDLQYQLMQVRLVGFGIVSGHLRALVRRTSYELEKEVDFSIIGEDIKLDKAVLDKVMPALEHMIRNALDHGIEPKNERIEKGKKEKGTLLVECSLRGREVRITIKDDGRGVDIEAVKEKALSQGLIHSIDDFKMEDIINYISQKGVTTASTVTKVSGRGVGMDVVQSSLRKVNGNITYNTEYIKGAEFTLSLPVSMAVEGAFFVHLGGEQFVISTRSIEQVIDVQTNEVRRLLNEAHGVYRHEDQDFRLLDVTDYLNLDNSWLEEEKKCKLFLVHAGANRLAVVIEKIEETQEVVIRNIGQHLGGIPIYSGAVFRPNGQVVLMLDMYGIAFYESFNHQVEGETTDKEELGLVMVVDDSLTVRKASQRDLVENHYQVVLSKDGLEAKELLQSGEKPNLILLDIEMPRMDGFEFLTWIKSETQWENIPVVIISSRATDKHIAKAKELGCAEFLSKPYLLDNLLSTLNKYI